MNRRSILALPLALALSAAVTAAMRPPPLRHEVRIGGALAWSSDGIAWTFSKLP